VNRRLGAVEESPLFRSITGKQLMKADWKDLACAVVICKVWKLAIVLQLLVVTTCKWSIISISNPKPRRESL
jgi:hypothetical protein